MSDLHNLEIVINYAFQALGRWLYLPAQFFTFLGSEEFYFLVMPVFYWCVDAALGLRLGLMLALSNGVNAALKLGFHSPRPYWTDPGVKALASEPAFGLPSGHAQNSASMWGLMGRLARLRWVNAAAWVLVLLIGLSRIYLGVHFLSDVVAGWLAGGLLLAAFLKLDGPVSAWVGRLSFKQLLLACVAAAGALFLVVLAASAATAAAVQVPPEWAANALAAGGEPIHPLGSEAAYTLGGTFLGLTAGAAWMFRRAGGFRPLPGFWQRAACYGIGLVGVMLFWFVLGRVLPRGEDTLGLLLRLGRYFLVGAWVSAGAPWLFKRLGLVQ